MKFNSKKLVAISLLVALNVILSRLVSISTLSFKISFTFLTLVVAAYLYGLPYAILVGGLGDLIGALLFPIGAFNPLFTITAMLSGLTYGLLLHDDLSNKKIIIAICINRFIVSLLINTLFISITYNSSYLALLVTRIYQNIIMAIIEFLTLKALSKYLPRLKEYINE